MVKTPLVDVALVTYNHEKFIAQAIESVLAQQTDFDYRLIIGDDCSTDDTQAIIRDYAQRYPERIVTLLYAQHVGILHKDRVGIKVLESCTAKYVAMLDGDDYWTDPSKLQKQVDFLESRPGFAICFHDALLQFDDGGTEEARRMCRPDLQAVSTLADILAGNFIPTCSVLFRRGLFGELPAWFRELPIGDWPLHVLNAEHGDIGYLNEAMAVYRVHRGGIWSTRAYLTRIETELKVYEKLRRHLGRGSRDLINDSMSERFRVLAEGYDSEGENGKARSYIQRYVGWQLRQGHIPGRRHGADLLRLSAPFVYNSLRTLKKRLARLGGATFR